MSNFIKLLQLRMIQKIQKREKYIYIYVLIYLLENIGKNETERIHPFNLWLDESWYMTPYFEMVFIIEVIKISFYYIFFSKFNIIFFCTEYLY